MKNASPFTSFFRSAPVFVSLLGCGLIAMVPFAATAAELYKCAGEGGIPVYQDVPCEKGKELRNLSGEDTLSVVPMRVEPPRSPPPPPSPPAAQPPSTPAAEAVLGNVPPTPLLPPAGVSDAPASGTASSEPPPGSVAAARMAIKAGMTAAEVETQLGPPPMTGGSDAPNQPVRWFYLPTEGDDETITTIVLQRGKVTEVERRPMKKM
ncbi:MAG: hypothetical protein LBE75_06770 [Burkholderiales bacterium]|jgi:hypothetical protein|nr:hypothetical protein [Burkholderiales bacterium]